MSVEFKPWPKIPRVNKNIITITEKIDGTNACIIVENGVVVGCQSRNRLLSLEEDNMGFARWVENNKESLSQLGEGYHYGEWAGPGIQKNPHKLDKKTFYYFNTHKPKDTLPSCVDQVPILYHGPYDQTQIDLCYFHLKHEENYNPEGIIIYNHSSRSFMKMTFANPEGKWKNE